MSDRRRHVRYDCHKKGHVDWHGVSYDSTVVNLAIADGRMYLCMHFDGRLPDVEVGAECELCLLEEYDPYPFKYTAKVIRIGASEIVFSIVDLHRHF